MLTHGHEDHIGAVPYLLAHKPDIPLVGSQFTLALVEAKLAERRIEPYTLTVGRAAGAARPVRVRVLRGQPLDPGRARGGHPHPGRAWCCTPATSRWTSCRWTAGSPTWPASPGSAPRASTCCCPTRPTPRSPASSRPEREIGPVLDSIFAKAQGPDHRRLVRLARAPRAAGARLRRGARPQGRLIGRSMVRNMGIARDLGLLHIPAGLVVSIDEATDAAAGPDRADVDRFAGRADERAGPDGQRRPPAHHHRPRRHGRAGLLAGPGQRDRRSTG